MESPNVTPPATKKKKKKNSSSTLPVQSVTDEASTSTSLQLNECTSTTLSIQKASCHKKYGNKFSLSWLKIDELKGWLQKSNKTAGNNELAFCKVCHIDLSAHKSDLIKHASSEKHLFKVKEVETCKNINTLISESTSEQQKKAEIKLAGFIAENNLPISTMDTLAGLLPSIFPDSKIAKSLKQHRTKAGAVIKNSLGFGFKSEINDFLKIPVSFFTIIMDETTDAGSVKQCAFVVIFYNHSENKVETRFYDMKALESSKAIDLVNCLKETLSANGIPLTNLVGFSSDTCNVMFGEHHSVVSLLKEELPDVAFIKCSCHLSHLVASKACLKLPRSVEDLLRNLGSHFSRSFSRQKKFEEFQQFFSVDIHKILSPTSTRWLSLKQCVDRVLEQYTPLKEYLRCLVFEDPSKTTEEMLSTMNSPFTQLYLEFLSYVLQLFTGFNVMFQSESPLLYKLKSETEQLLKTLCSNFIKLSHVKGTQIYQLDHTDSSLYIEKDKIYLGVQAHETFLTLKNNPKVPPKEIEYFQDSVLELLHRSCNTDKVKIFL